MSRLRALCLTLLALPLSACGIITIQESHPEPRARQTRSTSAAREAREAREANEGHEGHDATDKPDGELPLPPLESCPEDMKVSPGARTLDTRKLPEAKQSTFAKGHTKPPPADFYLTPDQAIDKVLAVEQKTPGLLPAGFRDEVGRDPRNVNLRLRMARCELESDATRRRASYDAAVALLLGGPKERALSLLVESTKRGVRRSTTMSCSPGDKCGDKMSCDPVYRTCVDENEKAVSKISLAEFDVEDVLTRALTHPVTVDWKTYTKQPLFWWGARRVHRCGGGPTVMCELSGYSAGNHTEVVSWDLRDGGTSYSPPERVQQWYRDHCETGSTTDCWGKKPAWVQ